MANSWYAKEEGRQYWIQLHESGKYLEFLSDPISAFAGGGYNYPLLPDREKYSYEWETVLKIFGKEATEEIFASAQVLQGSHP